MNFYPVSSTCQVPRLGEIYESVFGNRTDGCFVEVGAFDGEQQSNTSGLADIGWRGLYIEPVPLHVEACRYRHRDNPGVTVVECAVGDRPGRLPIQVAHFFSSFHQDSIDVSKDVYRNLRPDQALVKFDEMFPDQTISVEVRRLDEILTQHGVQPGFEVLIVDVEGHEAAVFDSFDLAIWQPKLMIVELLDLHPQYSKNKLEVHGLRAKLMSQGYEHLHVDEVNTVFGRVD